MTTRTLIKLFFVSALALSVSGCKLLKKDNAEVDAAATADTTTPTNTDEAGAAAEVADAADEAAVPALHTADNIPGPQEPDVVAADITRTNYKSELDRLTNEVNSEK